MKPFHSVPDIENGKILLISDESYFFHKILSLIFSLPEFLAVAIGVMLLGQEMKLPKTIQSNLFFTLNK